jgi:hypothetical protein
MLRGNEKVEEREWEYIVAQHSDSGRGHALRTTTSQKATKNTEVGQLGQTLLFASHVLARVPTCITFLTLFLVCGLFSMDAIDTW